MTDNIYDPINPPVNATQPGQAEEPGPSAPPEKKTAKMSKPVLIVFAVACAVMLIVVLSLLGKPAVKAPPPTPVLPRPTPTPERITSAVATQSAFLTLDSHVASLSAKLNNFILDDPQLTPPLLELPLGF